MHVVKEVGTLYNSLCWSKVRQGWRSCKDELNQIEQKKKFKKKK